MRNPTKPIVLALAFLAIVSVVQAAKKKHRAKARSSVPVFSISGDLRAPLRPGSSEPIALSLTNLARSPLSITAVQIRLKVDAAHAAAGCSADRDFAVTPLPGGAYPIFLPARRPFAKGWPAAFDWSSSQAWDLPDLGVADLPSVTMLDLPQTNQDACKGASLRLTFTGTARKAGTRAVRRP